MRRWIIILACLAVGAAQAQTERTEAGESAERGDVLLIEKVERARDVPVPTQGMRMEQVEARFGAPISRSAPVGDPPITRWRYAEFTVYFEHETVLHAVADRAAVGQERNS